ncbi:phosphopeptide-binding protein [Lewinellaceae bacterium SD302]|nr:phosphopeptide-binding protein [Lewinellaceae bacterium SD302]
MADKVAMEEENIEAEQPSNEAVLDAPGFEIIDRTDGVTLVDMPSSHSFPDAQINGITYSNGKFDFDVSGYEFGVQTPDAEQLMCANSDKGQHIHLIIDNEPYMAKYEPSFEQDITDGEHYMLTFLSRSYHQSIKRDRAARVAKVMSQDGAFTSMEDIKEPMLFYSRPKGTYRGKKATENIMVDFYPINAPFAEGYTVMAELDGEPLAKFSDWKSYYIKGMGMGEHTLTLTLMDKEGKAVDAPLNPVSRTFTLEELPTGE